MEHKYVFIFPGQGSQSVGMGFALAKRHSDFDRIFSETLREADATVGSSLSGIIKEGPAEKLKETSITQPALLTVSTAMARWARGKGWNAEWALGHSLGEYSALVHAESISFSEALKAVQQRGQFMESAVPNGEGGMAALLGGDEDAAKKLCDDVERRTRKVVEISALNAPGQIVVSGYMEAIDEVIKTARKFGIRAAKKLEVSGPFHCSLLKPAGEQLRAVLQNITINPPTCGVIANVTAREESTPSEILSNLVAQVSKAVLWETSIRYLASKGNFTFVEVGAGSVLTGLLKKILPDASVITLDTL